MAFSSLFLRGQRDFRGLGGPLSGSDLRQLVSDQVQFAAIQQFPLHFFTSFQTDRRRQGQGKIDIEPRLLILGADGLYFQWYFVCINSEASL